MEEPIGLSIQAVDLPPHGGVAEEEPGDFVGSPKDIQRFCAFGAQRFSLGPFR